MSVKIWIGREYDNTHENLMVAEAIAELEQAYARLAETCHVLVNFKIPGDPPRLGEHPYSSELDLAVLKRKALVIVDLKNYRGPIEYGDSCQWICHAPNGDVEVKGGRDGRTPHGQLCDYRRQMIRLIQCNQSEYLRPRRHSFDFRRFTSGMVLFPSMEGAGEDVGNFQNECGRWLSVRRMNDFATAIAAVCGGRDAELSEDEAEKLINKVFKLSPAHMVGNVPKVGGIALPTPQVVTVVKTVTVERPVEVRVEVPTIMRDEFAAVAMIYGSEDTNARKVRDLSDIFRRVVMKASKTRFRETQIRSLGTAAELLLQDDADLSLCSVRLFRLSAAIFHDAEGRLAITQQNVDETFKTVCRVVAKLCAVDIPADLREKCDRISYRGLAEQAVRRQEGLRALWLEVKSIDEANGRFTATEKGEDSGAEYIFQQGQTPVCQGDVICAVTPISRNGVWEASEIVLEPDYLISPQALGSASVYQNAEFFFWLNLIKDDPGEKYTQPGQEPLTMADYTLLGNFANTCLAERCACGTTEVMPLARGFCTDNLLEFTDANPHREWMRQCRLEYSNISNVIAQTLPNEHQIVGRAWQIEAPLYSPVYGLTARADALSYAADGNSAVVFELKSGKWECFRRNDPKEEHLPQPSFYPDILGFMVGIRRDAVLPFLYYAKTIEGNPNYGEADRHGRLFLRPTTRNRSVGVLMREFSALRNRILRIDESIRNETFRAQVDALKVDAFRNAGWTDNFWLNHRRPEIERLLSVFQNATELEKRYFYRMLRFAAEESFVARVGESGADIGRGGMASLWRLPVKRRREAGQRLSGLVERAERREIDGLNRVVRLAFDTTKDRLNSGAVIRQGDAVCLYADGVDDRNITNSIVFSATVETLRPGEVVILLDDPQPVSVFRFESTPTFALECAPIHGWSGYKCLWHFLTGDERRRRLVLNEVNPESDNGDDARLPVGVTVMERRYPGVSSWLERAWRAKDYFLLWGPPGTGKTSHAMRALVDEAMAGGKRVLLLAYTYKAADKICEMLESRIAAQNAQGVAPDLYMRIGKVQKCDERFRARLPERMGLANRDAVRDAVGGTRIFVATVSTVGPAHAICGLVRHFDLAIADEASQLLDGHILSLFCAHRQDGEEGPLIDKFVLIGDDRQLPAVVQQNSRTSAIDDKKLRKLGFRNCRESFFMRLKRLDDARVAAGGVSFCGLLDRQFRMHPMIADFCNRYFYDGKLGNGNAAHQDAALPPVPDGIPPFESYVLGTRLGFFPIEGGRDAGGRSNVREAKTCVSIVQVLLAHACRPAEVDGDEPRRYLASDIGVIVPFRNQIACMRTALSEGLGAEIAAAIEVDTVERYQGGERPVVLFSTVIGSLTQSDWISARRYDDDDDGDELDEDVDRKLNVAVTRAKERFFLVGNEQILNGLRAYGELLRWIADHEGFCE